MNVSQSSRVPIGKTRRYSVDPRLKICETKSGKRRIVLQREASMANFGRLQCAALGLLAVLLALPAFVSGQDIESGQYYSDSLTTNNDTIPYYFFAVSNDTIIVRVADEDTAYKDY